MHVRLATFTMLAMTLAAAGCGGQVQGDDALEDGAAQGELSSGCSYMRAQRSNLLWGCVLDHDQACPAAAALAERILAECPCGLDARPYFDWSQRNPDTTSLAGEPVHGVDILTVYYCSDDGEIIEYARNLRGGYESAPSEPAGCDYHACIGNACQQNLCRASY